MTSWESDKSEHLDKHTDISRFPLAFDISLGSHVLKKIKQYGGVEEPNETIKRLVNHTTNELFVRK